MPKVMEPLFDKKTFNINREYSNLMKTIIPSRKQTDFVNRAIKHELEREQEKRERQEVLKNLESLRSYRESLPKSKKPSEEVLAEMRAERIEHLSSVSRNQKNNE